MPGYQDFDSQLEIMHAYMSLCFTMIPTLNAPEKDQEAVSAFQIGRTCHIFEPHT